MNWSEEEYPQVSIIVPVLNRERTIGNCIESLLKLDYPSYEIIVIDNGSTDRTPEIVSKYPVKLTVWKGGGSYAARNQGLKMARGEIIAFTDSDCVVHKDWLKNLIRNYTSEEIGGVAGEIFTYDPGDTSIIERFGDIIGVQRIDLINNIDRKRQILNKDYKRFLSGVTVTANVSYRKTVLMEINGFDTDITSGGDVDLGWRVMRAGYKLVYDSEAIVWHKHRSTLKALIKQFFKYGRDQPLLLKKQPERVSYTKIKTYIFRPYEFGHRQPILTLINIDFCTLLALSLALIPFWFPFFYLSLPLSSCILVGLVYHAIQAVKNTRELKWLLLFPLLHIIRHFAFTAGRLYGGIKFRVIAI